MTPALQQLLDPAIAAGAIRPDVDAAELLSAVSRLSTDRSASSGMATRTVDLLVDGLHRTP